MEQIRSFIAIELPDEVKSALTRLEDRLKSGGDYPVKWVDPNNIHLTLKFLGNISSGRISEITAALETAVQGMPPFHLDIKGLGVFPNTRRVQVAWVGVSGALDRLTELQQRIESNVAPLGFPTESRPFSPHLTIARLRDYATSDDRQAFGQLIASTRFEGNSGFDVDYVNLMSSQLTREGPVYSRLSSVKLK